MMLLLLLLLVGLLHPAGAYGSNAQAHDLSTTSGQVDDALDSSSSRVMQSPWCSPASTAAVHWGPPALETPHRTVLGRPDVHTCSVVAPPPPTTSDSGGVITHLRLRTQLAQGGAGVRLYQVLLLECDASFWQLSGIQEQEHVCIANTAALLAACNQWVLPTPGPTGGSSLSCAPEGTAFALPGSLQGRVLVLQAHWRLAEVLNDTAVALPALQLDLGATTSPAAPPTGAAAAAPPALLGTFVGSGVYPPSSLSKDLQAFRLQVNTAAAGATKPSPPASPATATAELACGKRCTYRPLGRLAPRPVNVTGFSFGTFDRATRVAFEVQRGWAGRAAAAVAVSAAAGRRLAALQEPFQLFPGDIVRWRCMYDVSDLPPNSTLTGGHASHPAARQEQCTLLLHYWPRAEGLRGCWAALLDDAALLGEDMCSSEAADVLALAGAEARQFPLRRMYDEHSFPVAPWMGGWKATHLILQLAVVWATLWGSQTLLGSCKALGAIHTRFVQLAPGQQRNVAVYIAHLLLDTLALAFCCQPMLELWLGLTQTTGEVRTGEWCFTYIVAMYVLELTWRRRIDTMLAIHHIGTITIILLYAGELSAHTYRVANSIIVLAAFALMEQPTYVALLCKRMLPSGSHHVVRAARLGYISWFGLKGASVVLAASMFWEDWHLMPRWIRINFLLTWLVATLVQGWSGVIQYGIYRHILRAHHKALATCAWDRKQEVLKRQAAAALGVARLPATSSSDEEPEGPEGPDSQASSDEVGSPGALCRPLLLGPPSRCLGRLVASASTEDGIEALDSIAAARRLESLEAEEAYDAGLRCGGGGGGDDDAGGISIAARLPSRQSSCDSDCSSSSGGSCTCVGRLGDACGRAAAGPPRTPAAADERADASPSGSSSSSPERACPGCCDGGGCSGGCRSHGRSLGMPSLGMQDSLVPLPAACLSLEQQEQSPQGAALDLLPMATAAAAAAPSPVAAPL